MFKNIILFFLLPLSLFTKNEDVVLLPSWKNKFQFTGYYMAIEKSLYVDSALYKTKKNRVL